MCLTIEKHVAVSLGRTLRKSTYVKQRSIYVIYIPRHKCGR